MIILNVKRFFVLLVKFVKAGFRLKYIDYASWLRSQGIKVGENVNFRNPENNFIDLSRPSLIEFGDNLDINEHFCVLTHDFGTFVFRNLYGDFVSSSGKVVIGCNVVFGRNVTVLKGVTIGENSIIGAGSLITKSTPPNSVVAGVPARVICSLEEYYNKRKQLCVEEALEFGRCLIEKSGRDPQIEDFKEEWSLFLTRQEYENNAIVRGYVKMRLKDNDLISLFLDKKKIYNGFQDFLNAIKSSK